MIEGARPTIDDAQLGVGPPFGAADALIARHVTAWKARPIIRSAAMRAALDAAVGAPKAEQLEPLQTELVRSLRALGDPQQRESIELTLQKVDMLLAWSSPAQHGAALGMLAAERSRQPGANAADRLHCAATAIAFAAAAAPEVSRFLLANAPMFRERAAASLAAIAGRIDAGLAFFAAVIAHHRDQCKAGAEEVNPADAGDALQAWLTTSHCPALEANIPNNTVALDALLCPGPAAEFDPGVELQAFARPIAATTELSDYPEVDAALAEISAARRITPKALHSWRERVANSGEAPVGADGGELLTPTLRRLDATAALLGAPDAALRIGCWLATQSKAPDLHVRTRLIVATLSLLRIAATAHPCASHLADHLSQDEEPGGAYRELVSQTAAMLAGALADAPLAPRASGPARRAAKEAESST